jgi:hypothetical protein
VTRWLCPVCARLVASTGPVYDTVGSDGSRRYVQLRRHRRRPGVWCTGQTAPLLQSVQTETMEGTQ